MSEALNYHFLRHHRGDRLAVTGKKDVVDQAAADALHRQGGKRIRQGTIIERVQTEGKNTSTWAFNMHKMGKLRPAPLKVATSRAVAFVTNIEDFAEQGLIEHDPDLAFTLFDSDDVRATVSNPQNHHEATKQAVIGRMTAIATDLSAGGTPDMRYFNEAVGLFPDPVGHTSTMLMSNGHASIDGPTLEFKGEFVPLSTHKLTLLGGLVELKLCASRQSSAAG